MTGASRVSLLAAALAFGLTAPSAAESPAAESLPDAAVSSLFWNQEERIVGFRNFDAIYDTRPIDNGSEFLPLKSEPMDFSGLTYEVEGEAFTLEDHLESLFVAGILVAKGDRILLERYRLGHDETSRWVSYSIAKSVTSMLVGAAIEDGYIDSVDEQVTDYLPRLKGSAYDGATIRHLLQMASGVAWSEVYTDPDSTSAAPAAPMAWCLWTIWRASRARSNRAIASTTTPARPIWSERCCAPPLATMRRAIWPRRSGGR